MCVGVESLEWSNEQCAIKKRKESENQIKRVDEDVLAEGGSLSK